MPPLALTPSQIRQLIKKGAELPLATKNYPSRGQTAVQELYQTAKGKLFLKRSSKQNHIDCRISIDSGTLAEREFWAFRLAKRLKLDVPVLWLLDDFTTVQTWIDLPDAHQFGTSQGKLDLIAGNVFDCALFDWLTGQIDRHDANYLYDYANRRIILIDSAHSFLKYSGSIPDYLRYFEIGFPKALPLPRNTDTFAEIKTFSEPELFTLIPLRHQEEKSALISRWKRLESVHNLEDVIGLYRGGPK